MTTTNLPLSPESLAIGSDPFPAAMVPSTVPDSLESMALAERVEREATAYRARGTPDGDFLARQLERLAQLVRWTGANTPGEHEARMEVWDEELREQWFDRGYQEGVEAGRREASHRHREDRW